MPPTPSEPSDLLRRVLERSREVGFLGPGSVEAHIEHAASYVAPLGERRAVLDLGSGGGVPGLVLASGSPDLTMVLLDSMEKRCRFLEWAVEELALVDRVEVVCARAEVAARDPRWRATFDAVVARSFAPPPVTAECAVGFLTGPGARLVVSEPPTEPGRWPAEPLAELGLRVGDRVAGAHGTVQVLDVVSPCPDRFPRRTGIPAKRPLF